jgi:hypothetical protein
MGIEERPGQLSTLGYGRLLALPPGITEWLDGYGAWRPARRMGRMIGVMASDYEGVEEVARCERGDRGDTWRDNRRKGRKMRDNGLALW